MPISPSSSSDDRRLLLAHLDEALSILEHLHPLDDARFLETHVLYEGRSDQQGRIVDWFAEHVPPRIGAHRPFRVLSIGCGSGILDVPVARHLAAAAPALEYVGVDPNQVECDAFARRFDAAALARASLQVDAEPFEAFVSPRPFDLVHLVHCLYYLPDPAAALRQARALVGKGGQLVLIHAPREALNDLAVRFYDRGYGRPTPFAHDFAALFEQWQWPFAHQRIDAEVDVTPLIEGDPVVGPALRDFIVQFDTLRLPMGVQDLVDRYLRCIARVEPGRSTISHPVDVFVIDG